MLAVPAAFRASALQAPGCVHRSWRCWVRFLSHQSASERARRHAGAVVARTERLALSRSRILSDVQAASIDFRDAAADMTPLHVIRGLNAFAGIGFCNETLLLCVGERMRGLCRNTSPRRISHLVTLLNRLGITHPVVVDPLMDAVKSHLHNYVNELPDIIRNASDIGVEDRDLVSLLTTQALLYVDELGPLSIRCAEALSRYRHGACDLADRVKETYLEKLQELPLKQQMYMLGTFARNGHTKECQKVVNAILAHLKTKPPSPADVSRLLALQRSIGVVVPEVLSVIANCMELALDDPVYLKSVFPYQVYTMALLGKADRQILLPLLDRAWKRGGAPEAEVPAAQMLYAIAIMSREHGKLIVDDKQLREIINHLESCHRRLTIPQQAELYEAIKGLRKHLELPVSLAKFAESKVPSSLPEMCRGEADLQLGAVGGFSYAFVESGNGNREILQCVGEPWALTVVEAKSSLVPRPCRAHYAHTLESLLVGESASQGQVTVTYRTSPALSGKLAF